MTKKSLAVLFLIFISVFTALAQKTKYPVIAETNKINAEELRLLAKPTDKKPILINFWATWCGPCRAEFPDLIEIDADYRAGGLNFYIVSVDDFAIIYSRVPEFLTVYKSTMPSYLIDIEDRAEVAGAIRRIAPRFTDVYPLTLLFNANGKLVYQKSGRIDAKILRAQIEKVLPKSGK